MQSEKLLEIVFAVDKPVRAADQFASATSAAWMLLLRAVTTISAVGPEPRISSGFSTEAVPGWDRASGEPTRRERWIVTRSRLALSFGEKLDLDLVVGVRPAARHRRWWWSPRTST